MVRNFVERATERFTDGVAVGAVSSPLWLDSMYVVSSFAAHLLPILGCLWIGYQMYTHWHRKK